MSGEVSARYGVRYLIDTSIRTSHDMHKYLTSYLTEQYLAGSRIVQQGFVASVWLCRGENTIRFAFVWPGQRSAGVIPHPALAYFAQASSRR